MESIIQIIVIAVLSYLAFRIVVNKTFTNQDQKKVSNAISGFIVRGAQGAEESMYLNNVRNIHEANEDALDSGSNLSEWQSQYATFQAGMRQQSVKAQPNQSKAQATKGE